MCYQALNWRLLLMIGIYAMYPCLAVRFNRL